MSKKIYAKQLIACFREDGFQLDFDIVERTSVTTANEESEQKIYEESLADPYRMLFYLGCTEDGIEWSASLAFLHKIAVRFIQGLAKTPDIEEIREETRISPTEPEIIDILASVPYAIGIEYIDANWIKRIYKHLSTVFTVEIRSFSGTVSEFLLQHNAKINIFGKVFFHLVENKSDSYPFAFLATYSTGKLQDKKAVHTPLKNALLEFKGRHDLLLQLLSTVSKAAQTSEFISEFVESGELFSPLKFTSREAYTFLKEIPLYEQCGILCRMPDWWKKSSHSFRLSVKVGDREPSRVGMDALLSFSPELYFGEEKITEEEFRSLVAQTSGLSFIKGKWVEVDHEKLQATLEAYENAKKLSDNGEYSIAEAMRIQLNAATLLGVNEDAVNLEVSNGEWLNTVTAKLTNPTLIANTATSDDFRATLRAYQQKGFDWLNYMKTLGFGACLADDMGLGKTVQIIALLEHMRVQASNRSLLIIPASLMGNWQKELEKFAPMLNYKLVFSSKDKLDLSRVEGTDLYITTYGMVARLDALRTVEWDLVILDEAQAVKNPGTKQTKAVKQLHARARIAMTGTPIENSLSDLWSLFDFLNTGLLGSAKEFKLFTKGLKESKSDYAKLRSVVSPFILRRLKTDKTVIADLPEKMEMKAYATLTKKQVVLYTSLVKELKKKLEVAEGIERKGLVLASIMKFKQICNHPDQYLGQSEFLYQHSGKYERLSHICETIYKKRERVLVFTQFKEMTKPLSDFLTQIFKREGLILHGQTPVKKRAELVDRFCGEEYVPYMVLSLKAGGVGLNLTAANHVIHFDRWWNPAVENQATDRAFRIGQQKNVMVHKFITSGTIEEKIDMMIEDKSKLASDIIASSKENWITELDNNQLLELFTLV